MRAGIAAGVRHATTGGGDEQPELHRLQQSRIGDPEGIVVPEPGWAGGMGRGKDTGDGPEVRVGGHDLAVEEPLQPAQAIAVRHRLELGEGQGAAVGEQEAGLDEGVADG